MLRKSAVCFMALACAAAFTFVSAQLPWESGSSPSETSSSDESSSGGESSSEASSSEESSYSTESSSSSDESSSSSLESVYSTPEPSSEEEAVVEETAAPAKPKKEKPAKAAKERTAAAGFNTQKSCPVCNSTRIKTNLYVESNKGNLHVCSIACIGRVSRNPDKFIEILKKRGDAPEK